MWFYAALLMSFVTGIYIVISKHVLKKMDPVIFYWITVVASTPLILILVWKNGIPAFDSTFFVSIFGSVVFYTIAKIIFWRTIKDSTLSEVVPLVTLGPVFTLILSVIILSEKLTLFASLGCLITLFGTYVLNVSSVREGLLEPFKILFKNKLALLMMLSVFAGAFVTIFDKTAILHTFPQNASFALLIENLVIVLGLLPWVIRKRKTSFVEIFSNKKLILLLGILSAVSNLLIFFALSGGNPGLITSILRTQVFFVLLFSSVFFKDYPKLETVIGSIIMILGLVVIKIAS